MPEGRHHRPRLRYNWSQTDEQIKICVEPEGWKFADIAVEDVSVELTSPTSLKATVEYGGSTHALILTRLRGKIAALTWKKTKKRLVITLDKKDTALGWDKEWKELISDKAPKEPPEDDDTEEAD